MSDPLNNDGVAFNVKLDAIVARSYAVATGQRVSERLCAADVGPSLKPLQDAQDTVVDRAVQCVKFTRGVGAQQDPGHTGRS